MIQAETVLELLGQNGGSLKDSTSFNLSHVQSMGSFVQEHLATGQEPVGRGALNAKLIECGQVRTNSGSRAVGFCYVVFAYHILHETSPHLFHSTEGFLLKYPDYATGTHADINSALTMCNMTIAALKILKGEKNKAAFVEIVTRICLGPEASVITGGGKVGGDEKRTLPAERFYVEESGIIPEKTKKGTKKRALEEDLQDVLHGFEEEEQPASSAAAEVKTESEVENSPYHLSPQGTLSMPVGASLPTLEDLSPLLRGAGGSEAGSANESSSEI